MKSNTDFVDFLNKAVNREDVYILGGFGNVLTTSFIDQKCRQYPYNQQNKELLLKNIGKIAHDCYGILKAFVWDNENGEGHYNINNCPDRNEQMAFSSASEKGVLSSIPQQLGVAVYRSGHVGFVVNCSDANYKDWMIAEAYNISKGCIFSRLGDSTWTHWFKDTYLDYTALDYFIHVLKAGEYYNLLANMYNVPVNTLIALNADQGYAPTNLPIGMLVKIPKKGSMIQFALTPDCYTFYSVARKFKTTVAAIKLANPTLDPMNLQIGMIVNVPV